MEIARNLFHIRRREAEGLRMAEAEDAVDFEVVQRGENIFLRDAQHACQHGKVERWIRLQRRGKEFAEKIDGIVIILMLPGRLDRRIVFIQQEHRLFPIVLLKEVQQ